MIDKCPKCGSNNTLMIEYALPYHPDTEYDGISEIRCQDCGVRIGRWSEVILKDGEMERRYGGKPVKIK